MITQRQLNVPHLGLYIWLLSTGEVLIGPHPNFQPTYEHSPDGVSSFMDTQGLILWEPGSKEFEYDFNYAYMVNYEPLLRGWLMAQNLSLPE